MMKTAHCQKSHSLLLPLTHSCVFSSHNRSIVSVILGTVFLEFLMLNSVLPDTKFLPQIFFEYLIFQHKVMHEKPGESYFLPLTVICCFYLDAQRIFSFFCQASSLIRTWHVLVLVVLVRICRCMVCSFYVYFTSLILRFA